MTALVENRLPLASKISVNAFHSAILIAAITGCLLLTAWTLAGLIGLAVMLLCVSAVLFLDPKLPGWSSMDMYRGKKQPADTSQIASLVDVLAYRAGLERRPDLYVIPSLTLSAFSGGTVQAPAIAVTEGLLRRLTLRETAGVLAHEMIHIRNGDTGVFKLADLLSRLTSLMALVGVLIVIANIVAVTTGGEQVTPWLAIALLILAPAFSSALQMALSHAREKEADAEAASLTADPMGLASALQRMENSTGTVVDDFRIPLPARRVPYPSLLRAHAADKVRIARLLNPHSPPSLPMFDPIVIVEQPMVSLVGYGPGEMRPRLRWNGLWY